MVYVNVTKRLNDEVEAKKPLPLSDVNESEEKPKTRGRPKKQVSADGNA